MKTKEGDQHSSNQAAAPLVVHHPQHYSNYYNCAAPKSKIAQNCLLMRQIQNDLPPYPSNLGCYDQQASPQHRARPSCLSGDVAQQPPPSEKLKKHPGILKNYKSCPVSPVHEELDWSAVSDRANPIKINETRAKRHTMYCDDAQNIIDMIQIDTERMIAEITEKYGDLDEYQPKSIERIKSSAKKEKHEHNFLSDEEGNFSSDSLEECSLDIDCDKEANASKPKCKKHSKKDNPTQPKRSVSEYFIYDDFYTQVDLTRKVSLSDILNDDRNDRANEQRFLETQRHSSASFFLGRFPERRSQESILSDEFGGENPVSYCNSMESILSDESECKSAPLEALFEKGKMGHRNVGTLDRFDTSNSKSYGSSPNSTNFDYFMQQRMQDNVKCDLTNYNFDSMDARSFKVISSGGPQSPTHRIFPSQFSVQPQREKFDDEYIPSLSAKTAHYNTNLNKSLSKDFASQRRQNTLHYDADFQPKPIIRTDIFAEANVSTTFVMKKSCSFEIDMCNGQKKFVQNSKKFQQNLRRFENDRWNRRDEEAEMQKSDYNLEMGFVAHKPPVAHRRSASMKGRRRSKIKMNNHTISTSQTTSSLAEMRDFVNTDYLKKSTERTFEFSFAEKDVYEDDDKNSWNVLKFPKFTDLPDSSFDTLELPPLPVNAKKEETGLISEADLGKFRDIEKKIDVINKLVEMEEKKYEQEKIRRANRMKPLFNGNTKERGFVKHLTRNFDKLAKYGFESFEDEFGPPKSSSSGLKRNYSLPDVLEGAKCQFRTFEFDEIDDCKAERENEPTILKLFDFDEDYGEGVKHGNTSCSCLLTLI